MWDVVGGRPNGATKGNGKEWRGKEMKTEMSGGWKKKTECLSVVRICSISLCVTGHRELQLAVPDTCPCQEYQFDEVTMFNQMNPLMLQCNVYQHVESTISEHSSVTPRHAEGATGILNGLTYEEVFWARKIDNPLVGYSKGS